MNQAIAHHTRFAGSLGRRLLNTDVLLLLRCARCRTSWSPSMIGAEYPQILASPAPHGRMDRAFFQRHRTASSIRPRLDPDVERLQQSIEGMSPARPAHQLDCDRLIYEVRAANYVKVAKIAFYVTAISGLYMAPDFIVGAWESDTLSLDTIFNLAMVAFGVVIMPCVMTLLARRLVLKMYHNEAKGTYIAVVSKHVIGTKRNHFAGADVKGLPVTSFERMFRMTSFRVKGRPYFVNAAHFKAPSDYNKLMHFT